MPRISENADGVLSVMVYSTEEIAAARESMVRFNQTQNPESHANPGEVIAGHFTHSGYMETPSVVVGRNGQGDSLITHANGGLGNVYNQEWITRNVDAGVYPFANKKENLKQIELQERRIEI